MAGSTLPAVRTRIVAILAAIDSTVPAYHTWPGYEKVWQDRGGASGAEPRKVEAAWLDSIASGTSSYPTFRAGRKRREEQYSQIVSIGAQWDTDATLEAVEARVMALFVELEEAIADDPAMTATTLVSGQQIIKAAVSDWELESGPVENGGFTAVITATVTVEARIL